MQAFYLVGEKDHRGVSPAEGDVRVVALFLRGLSNGIDERLGLSEVFELECPGDAHGVVIQGPSGRLIQICLRFVPAQGGMSPWQGMQLFFASDMTFLLLGSLRMVKES